MKVIGTKSEGGLGDVLSVISSPVAMVCTLAILISSGLRMSHVIEKMAAPVLWRLH
jgi:hypothetical protein